MINKSFEEKALFIKKLDSKTIERV